MLGIFLAIAQPQKIHTSTGGFGQTSSPQMRRVPFSEEPSRGTNGALVLWDPKIWKNMEKGLVQELYFPG